MSDAARPRRWLDVTSWVVFAVVASRTAFLSLTQDFRRQDLVSDQASFLYTALSIVHDHDLSYLPGDAARWRSIGWTPAPTGLFFQRFNDGVAFAKPYGYPLYLAPFIWVFGPGHGVAIANTVLVAGAVVAVLFLVHKRYSWSVAAWVTTALLLVSNVTFYALPIGVEPFYVCLMAVFFLAAWNATERGQLGWGLLAIVLAAFLVSEKQPLALVVLPVVLVVLVRQRSWLRRGGVVAAGVAMFALAVLPYYHYSNGRSITPYGGLRYYSYGGQTFVGPGSDAGRSTSDSVSSLSYVRANAFNHLGLKGGSGLYYLFGQHTGLLVWLPLAVLVVILTLVDLRRTSLFGAAALVGMVAYVAFYLLLFPSNAYGGAQVIGNRYFVQISPVVAAIVVGARIRTRRLVIASALSMAIVLAMLWPQYVESPRDALVRMDRTSWLQDQMMWESHVQGVRAFDHVPIPTKQRPLSSSP